MRIAHPGLALLRIFAITSLLTGAFGGLSFADPPPLTYIPYREAANGLSQKEAEGLKSVYDSYRVIDLDHSNFTQVESWFDKLNERLTAAVEKQGTAFPRYKISLMASAEPTGFIYKSQVPGQKVFRGHVFVSVGLIGQMLDTMGADPKHLKPEEVDQLLNGLEGVISHEFSHPKQDELVKWSWRAEQGGSRQNHGQVDEMSTDIMSLRVAKDAKIDPKNVLNGLELVMGQRPDNRTLGQKAASAAVSTHPQANLRLNLVRAGLTKMRMDEGRATVEPIPYNPSAMTHELEQVLVLKQTDARLEMEPRRKPGSLFSNTLHALQEELAKPRGYSESFDPIATLREYYRVLQKAEREAGRLSDSEIHDFVQHIEFMLRRGRFGLVSNYNAWQTSSGGQSGNGIRPSLANIRSVLRETGRIEAFKDPRFQAWFESIRRSGELQKLILLKTDHQADEKF
ncbi:hypothetical protein WDW37_08305 [Bdellovibrionota bacterium FG-1]